MKLRLTQRSLRKLKPGERRTIYRDSDLKGFAVEVMPSGHMSFIAEGRIKRGPTCRIRVGTYPTMPIKEARAKARDLLTQMQKGIDPRETERGERAKAAHRRALDVAGAKSLQSVWDEFLAARDLKDRTRQDYNNTYRKYFEDWHDQPIRSITRKLIEERFKKLQRERGQATAQKAMRIMSSVMNHAKADEVADGERLLKDNPVDVLRDKRLRRVLKPRTGSIPLDMLGEFVTAVNEVTELSQTANAVRDLVMLVLLTGLRKEEALHLRWDDVNYPGKYLCITDTKNSMDHYVPLSDWVRSILADRIISTQYSGTTPLDSPEAKAAVITSILTELDPRKVNLKGHVFPSTRADGPLTDPRRIIKDIGQRAGVTFTLHDLRRTFATICHHIGLDERTTKQAMNHKDRTQTQQYIQVNVEMLRQPMQQVAAYVRDQYQEVVQNRADKAGVVLPLKV